MINRGGCASRQLSMCLTTESIASTVGLLDWIPYFCVQLASCRPHGEISCKRVEQVTSYMHHVVLGRLLKLCETPKLFRA